MGWRKLHFNYSQVVSLFTSVLAFSAFMMVLYMLHFPCCKKYKLTSYEEDGDGRFIHARRNRGRFRGLDSEWYQDNNDLPPKPGRGDDLLAHIPNFSKLSRPIIYQKSPQQDIDDTTIPFLNPKIWLNDSAMDSPQCNDSICSEYLSTSSQSRFISCIQFVKGRNGTLMDGKCHFIDGTGRRAVALVSFPGSGNTWTRVLLESTTGICTGAVYCDISLRAEGFVGEHIREASTLIVKTHENEPRWFGSHRRYRSRLKHNQGEFQSAIFLVRNPFRALVAEWNRKVANNFRTRTVSFGTHVKSVGREWFGNNMRWVNFVYEQAQRWQAMIKNWVIDSRDQHPVLVVKYEELKSSTLLEVERMLDFLHVGYDEEDLEDKIRKQSFNLFHRKHRDEKFEHFNSEQVEYVRSIVNETAELLKENDMEDLIDLSSYYTME